MKEKRTMESIMFGYGNTSTKNVNLHVKKTLSPLFLGKCKITRNEIEYTYK